MAEPLNSHALRKLRDVPPKSSASMQATLQFSWSTRRLRPRAAASAGRRERRRETCDWAVMQHAADMLERFGIAYEARVVSAHRTPDLLYEYAAEARQRGLTLMSTALGAFNGEPALVQPSRRDVALGLVPLGTGNDNAGTSTATGAPG